MKVVGKTKQTDWPKLDPSILIVTALIVAIQTAKWPTKTSSSHSDVDLEMDREVSFAVRISFRVMRELLRKHEKPFPQRAQYIYEAGSEEDTPE